MSKDLISMEYILCTDCLHPSEPLLELMQDNDQHSCFFPHIILISHWNDVLKLLLICILLYSCSNPT